MLLSGDEQAPANPLVLSKMSIAQKTLTIYYLILLFDIHAVSLFMKTKSLVLKLYREG